MLDPKPYPVDYREHGSFSFFWLYLALAGIVLYYISEMLNRVIYFSTFEIPPHQRTWRIVDSAIYAISFVFISFQMVSLGVNFRGYENRVRARRTFIGALILAALILIYEYLMLNMPIEQRKQSDYGVLFIMLLIVHYYVIHNVKRTIQIIGREKKVKTGTSVFYTLFALNLVIRYLLQYILIIFISVIVKPYVFVFYSELVMTYIASAIAFIATIYIILDLRKIKIAQLIEAIEEDKANVESKEIFSATKTY